MPLSRLLAVRGQSHDLVPIEHMPALPSPRRRPHYDPSRDRGRLRQLFWMGVVLVFLFEFVRQPASWAWLTELDRPRARREEPVAPRAKLGPESLPPGVLRIEQAVDVAAPDAAAPVPLPPADDVPVVIPPELVALIDHEYHVIRGTELPVLARMLAAVRASSPSRLEQASRREATFTELANDPERYSGGLFRFQAEVRRCGPITTRFGDGPEEKLFEAWVFTETGGRKNPYRILCTDLPAGFPTGESIRARVNVTAYFVKQYAYVTAHGPHVAPMFIARRFRWTKPPQKLSDEVGAAPVLTLVLASVAVGLSLLAWRLTAQVGRGRSRILNSSLGNTAVLPGLAPDGNLARPVAVEEFLRTLATTESPTETPAMPPDSPPSSPEAPLASND